ncbi:LacI family transcriptional regulator [Streptomyces platensis]|uniref:HTH-type transcriptional regulator DegA n=1 Tax=Streptomyces platensis TaxID=58346 RepID=A0AAE6NH60_STRPT|nr:LacI family DNA-binding transcriptional regulator [Streptomyces platensis]OSY37245.1 HTH-type transcriptional regulator DegA [Streptomyces platensis]QEV52632.1 LacI family transcriptional regulator [Streptomyces platensis]
MERSNGRLDERAHEQADEQAGGRAAERTGAGGTGRPPTIRGVAERAGVSKSLVSLVLQGSPRVSDTKRQAVLDAIEELGYRPNAAARSLVARRTHTVGVLLNDMRNPWFVEVLDGLNSLLQAHGLRMLMADGRLDRRAGQDFARTFQELRVDGLVVVGTLPDTDGLAEVAARLPTVIAGNHEPRLPHADLVANDDERGARLATEHLIGLGHRRIAHIAGQGLVGELRRRGFETAMRAHGLAGSAVVTSGDGTEEGGYRAAVRLLTPPSAPVRPADRPCATQRPTAVFAFNDISGVGALSAAQELGLRIPSDLSLVGYDNTYLARIRHLWLNSVNNASHEVGRRAARCLLDRMERPDAPAGQQLVAPELEIRGSTAAPPPD